MILIPRKQWFCLLLVFQPTMSLLSRQHSSGDRSQHRRESLRCNKETPSSEWLLPRPQPEDMFLLPVFPLRKTVRLPTERLTLNLYEQRYLAMAEAILSSGRSTPLFGTIYSSNKAHIVKDGTGPVVPLLENGDIGVVFLVTDAQDDMVDTIGGQARRRRIRLEAQGAVRFQICRVVHTGYDTIKDESFPYILVQAALVVDKRLEDEAKLKIDAPFELDKLAYQAQAAMGSHLPTNDLEAELASFAVASARHGDAEIDKRMKLLRLQSTLDRHSAT